MKHSNKIELDVILSEEPMEAKKENVYQLNRLTNGTKKFYPLCLKEFNGESYRFGFI